MSIFFKRSFINDFKKLPQEVRAKVKEVCTQNIFKHPVKPIVGFKDYYRLRIGDYRLGFKKEGNSIIFMRVKHRKDIYRFFP